MLPLAAACDFLIKNKAKDIEGDIGVIAVNKDGDMYWNDALIPDKETLLNRLREAAPRKPQPEVHIRGDLSVRYEYVGRVVAYCQKAGIVRVGFLTEPSKN